MSTSWLFPTFCHISEYGENGYQNLHRMLAMSYPLNLWAPSSVLLRSPACKVPVNDFIGYVESGLIRVSGRQHWLTSSSWRSAHSWEGARWDGEVDGKLLSFCEEDKTKAVEQRRVIVAPDEMGWERADDYLDANPTEIDRWCKLARSKAGRTKIPAGTLQSALRQPNAAKPRTVAKAILRDAYNHGEAFAESGAETAFLLTPADRQFLKVLATAPSHGPASTGVSPSDARRPTPTVESLTKQMLDVLQHLDVHAPDRAKSGSLDRFLQGDGHRELVTWFSNLCQLLKDLPPSKLDGKVIAALRRDLRGARFISPLRGLIRHRDESFSGAAGLICALAGLVTDPIGPLTLAGFAFGVYRIGKGLCRQLGWVPTGYTGQQWPFSYTYDSEATKRLWRRLGYVLEEFEPGG